MAPTRLIFLLCYGASGAAALVYQVAWTRLFTLQLGQTVAASSTVLAAFMAGLAAGSSLASRWRFSARTALRAYAACELGIALIALALPALLDLGAPVLAWAYADGTTPATFAVARLMLSLVLLGLPAAAMGATFPIAIAAFSDRSEYPHADRSPAGALYAANTAGAAVGAIATGFVLLPVFGLRGSTLIGVLLNLGAAAGCVLIAGRRSAFEEPGKVQRLRSKRAPQLAQSIPEFSAAAVYVAAICSGFIALGYEVAWTRLIALVMGPTTYAFSLMAASFITGIALGSAATTQWLIPRVRPGRWLWAALCATVLCSSAGSWFAAGRVPLQIARALSEGAQFDALLRHQVVTLSAVLLPLSISLGTTFSLALAAAATAHGLAERSAARVYAVNTAGALAGALLTGFVLIPVFGLEATFLWLGRVGVAGGLLTILLWNRRTARTRKLALATAGFAVVMLSVLIELPEWDRKLLTSGAYKYSRYLPPDSLAEALRAGKLEYYRDGAAGTVSVRSVGGSRALAIDGKIDASSGGDMLTQRLLGVLPVLHHARPSNALVIGLGSGVTVGSLLSAAPSASIDVVEISPEVVQASAFFSSENMDVLRRPGVRLLIGDGRSHLALTSRQYDIIVSEPSNPWMAGVSALFTQEFFETARSRLKPGGVLCQWTHTYELDPEDLQSIVATFGSVFPQATMWLVGDGDLLLVGTVGPGIDSRWPVIAESVAKENILNTLADIGFNRETAPFVLLSMYAGGPDDIARFGEGSTLQVDDRVALEFSAVRSMYRTSPVDNAAQIRASWSASAHPQIISTALASADARSWIDRGRVALEAEAYDMASNSFRRALAVDQRSAEAFRGVAAAAEGAHDVEEALKWLQEITEREPRNAPARVELSRLLAKAGATTAAIHEASLAMQEDPASPDGPEQLAAIFMDLGDETRLTSVSAALRSRFPGRAEGRYYEAASLFLRGLTGDAADSARALLATNPRHAKAQNLLGAACASTGDLVCAESAFDASIRNNPREPSAYLNLGMLLLQTNRAAQALDVFTEALALDPRSVAALNGIRQARSMLDQ